MSKGLSQSALASVVGLSFQQVQKYEKGTNRVSASRLSEFAAFLEVEVSYFFEGATRKATARHERAPRDTLNFERIDFEILRSVGSIEDTGVKRKLLDLINHLGRSS